MLGPSALLGPCHPAGVPGARPDGGGWLHHPGFPQQKQPCGMRAQAGVGAPAEQGRGPDEEGTRAIPEGDRRAWPCGFLTRAPGDLFLIRHLWEILGTRVGMQWRPWPLPPPRDTGTRRSVPCFPRQEDGMMTPASQGPRFCFRKSSLRADTGAASPSTPSDITAAERGSSRW